MVIFNNQQLEIVNTELQAKKFIENHRATPGIGTIFVESESSRVKVKSTRKKSME